MTIKQEIKDAKKLLNKMYKKVMENVTEEQWQEYLEEIKKRQVELDGRVLEGAELEETAKANLMARLAEHAKGQK